MDDCDTLVVLSCYDEEFEINEDETEENIVRRRVSRQISSKTYLKLNFNFSFYNHNLKLINYVDGMIFNSFINENTNDDSYFDIWNLFIKSIYLGKQYTMFVYIIEKNLYIYFELIEMNYFIGMKRIEPKKWGKKGLYGFDIYKTLNDFVKIDEMRVAFAFITSYKAAPDTGSSARRNLQNNNRFLIILLIDIIESSNKLNIREYYLTLENIYPQMQISTHSYNGFLIFATTALYEADYLQNSDNYFSLLMIFEYANGTDNNINIRTYLEGENQNIFRTLPNNLKIDNNIFGFKSSKKIKLISIPEEITIYENGKALKNNSIVDIYNENILKPNTDLLKTSKYYYIEYQYIIGDAEDDDSSEGRRRNADLDNLGQRIYYGRINRIEFKLCHEYCETCYELSTSYDDQKCLSCLPLYQFDFLYYNGYYNDNAQVNCVPEEYYNKLYNLNGYILIPCNRDDCKFYHNVTDSKTICFNESYDCPKLYPYYVETTKTCHICNYSLFKNEDCSLDFDNNTSQEEKYEIIKNGIIADSGYSGESLKINGANNFAYQISSFKAEYSYLRENKQRDFSIIDLKECADILRKENGLLPNADLTILKYENDDYNNSNGNDKSIQYEVYPQNSNKKLDLSVCSDVKIGMLYKSSIFKSSIFKICFNKMQKKTII